MKFGAEAKLGKLSNQAICFDYGWTAIEMAGPEVVVFNAVLKHVVDRRKHRGGHRTDRFLRAAPGLEAIELRCPSS